MQRRVVKLDEDISRVYGISDVIGFADGIGVFYLKAHRGILTIDLNSGRLKNIYRVRGVSIIPYMTFYTPGATLLYLFPSTNMHKLIVYIFSAAICDSVN
jgi:hypothetical protein